MKKSFKICLLPGLALLIGMPVVLQAQTNPDLLFYTDYNSAVDTNSLTGPQLWQAEQEPTAPGLTGPVQTTRMSITTAPGNSSDPYRPTTKVMRVELRPRQNPDIVGPGDPDDGDVLGAGSRAEVYARHAVPGGTVAQNWPDPVGSVRWYGWSTYFPMDFVDQPSNFYWFTMLQLKGYKGGSPPMAMELHSNKVNFRVKQNYYALGTPSKGNWVRYVIGVKLATDNTGWVQVFRNGAQLVNLTNVSNMDIVNGVTDPIYLKQGIYRSGDWTATHVLYNSPMKVGLTYNAVANP